MICPKCKIDVVPDMPLMTCPECWSPINLKWNPSVMGGSVNKAIKHRGAVNAAKKLGCLPEHTETFELFFSMMERFDRLYDLDHGLYYVAGPREGDTVIKIEERALVSSVVAAIIVAFFVVNEIFNFF